MYTINCTTIERTYSNHGQHCEQMLAYTLTNEMRSADHVPFDVDSDIPEFHMSVKSSRATLASARAMRSTTYMEQIDEFFARTASTCFAYVSMENVAYVMNADEFRAFLLQFSSFQRESSTNGGGYKIRLNKESGKMLKYLTACLVA